VDPPDGKNKKRFKETCDQNVQYLVSILKTSAYDQRFEIFVLTGVALWIKWLTVMYYALEVRFCSMFRSKA
jgi:hypothetical protein